MIDAKTPVTIIDARTKKFDDGNRIAGAVNLTDNSTDEEIAKAIPGKDTLVVAYCGSKKCPLSSKLSTRLKEMGYKNVVVYKEGLDGWKNAGYAFDKAK